HFHLGVHKATLAKAGAAAGDLVDITLEIDDQPLPGDTLPAELARALRKNAAARHRWEALAPSHRREHVNHIEQAKRPETRALRVDKTLKMLASKPPAKRKR